MGFLGVIIGEKDYFKLGKIKYSVKINNQFRKKSIVFNGIKNALSSNMNLKDGYQNSSEKKQFYRELICKPSYIIFVDLSLLETDVAKNIELGLKEHKSFFTPYLGINFCIADFEWIQIQECQKLEVSECEVDTCVLQEDFIFESSKFEIKLTSARMANDCENGRIFKDFKDFIINLSINHSLKAKNNGQIYNINGYNVYFI